MAHNWLDHHNQLSGCYVDVMSELMKKLHELAEQTKSIVGQSQDSRKANWLTINISQKIVFANETSCEALNILYYTDKKMAQLYDL